MSTNESPGLLPRCGAAEVVVLGSASPTGLSQATSLPQPSAAPFPLVPHHVAAASLDDVLLRLGIVQRRKVTDVVSKTASSVASSVVTSLKYALPLASKRNAVTTARPTKSLTWMDPRGVWRRIGTGAATNNNPGAELLITGLGRGLLPTTSTDTQATQAAPTADSIATTATYIEKVYRKRFSSSFHLPPTVPSLGDIVPPPPASAATELVVLPQAILHIVGCVSDAWAAEAVTIGRKLTVRSLRDTAQLLGFADDNRLAAPLEAAALREVNAEIEKFDSRAHDDDDVGALEPAGGVSSAAELSRYLSQYLRRCVPTVAEQHRCLLVFSATQIGSDPDLKPAGTAAADVLAARIDKGRRDIGHTPTPLDVCPAAIAVSVGYPPGAVSGIKRPASSSIANYHDCRPGKAASGAQLLPTAAAASRATTHSGIEASIASTATAHSTIELISRLQSLANVDGRKQTPVVTIVFGGHVAGHRQEIAAAAARQWPILLISHTDHMADELSHSLNALAVLSSAVSGSSEHTFAKHRQFSAARERLLLRLRPDTAAVLRSRGGNGKQSSGLIVVARGEAPDAFIVKLQGAIQHDEMLRDAWRRFGAVAGAAKEFDRHHTVYLLTVLCLGIATTTVSVILAFTRLETAATANNKDVFSALTLLLVVLPIFSQLAQTIASRINAAGRFATLQRVASSVLREIMLCRCAAGPYSVLGEPTAQSTPDTSPEELARSKRLAAATAAGRPQLLAHRVQEAMDTLKGTPAEDSVEPYEGPVPPWQLVEGRIDGDDDDVSPRRW